ncbi:MAG: ABC transporter permease [Maricaulaceae bacterium]
MSGDADVARKLDAARRDIAEGLRAWRIWLAFAQEDLRQIYKRTVLGVAWIAVSFALFVGVKTLVFGALSTADARYFAAHVALGFWVWQFAQGAVSEGAMAFVNAEPWIKGARLPISVFVFAGVARLSFSAALTGGVVVALMAIVGVTPQAGAPWAFLGATLVLLNALWVQFLAGALAARWRDLAHLLNTALRVTFFLTPIVWLPEQMGRLGDYVWWNPFAHALEVVRGPILDPMAAPPTESLMVMAALGVTGGIAAWIAFALSRPRLAYWL